MKKIPTLYQRDPDDMRRLTRERHPATAWVDVPGSGVRATRKYDGTCLFLDDDGRWWARREVKPGKAAPSEFVAVDTDTETGKTMGWEPVEQSAFAKAFRSIAEKPDIIGTYELCGPSVNQNPEGLHEDTLIEHGQFLLRNVPTGYDELREYLAGLAYEGIVWHHPDGRMAKIKRKDFLLPAASSSAVPGEPTDA